MVAEAEDGESAIFSTFLIHFWHTMLSEAEDGESVIFFIFPHLLLAHNTYGSRR